METFYKLANISRQAFNSWMQVSDYELLKTKPQDVISMARHVRKHFLPGSGVRQIYRFIRHKHPDFNSQLIGWGKHNFEHLSLNSGLRIQHKRFIPVTTQRGAFIFPNLIEGSIINDINLIWVSDISYIFGDHGRIIGYSTTLIDVYSRRLLGLSFSPTMHAVVTSQAVLFQAFKQRTEPAYPKLIFHSDGGRQYIEGNFLSMLNSKKISSSMARSCYENPYAESFNDLIKNHLLADYSLNSFRKLKKLEPFIKKCYNMNRSHGALNNATPEEFERSLPDIPKNQRFTLQIPVLNQNS